MSAAPLQVAALTDGLSLRRVGRHVVCIGDCDSTNLEAARRVAEAGRGIDGWVIFAERQTAGRGRLGRRWDAPRGSSILMTAIICEPTAVAQRLVLAAAVAVCDAVQDAAHVTAALRWPNDVYVGPRKLAGVLVESTPIAGTERAFLVGIGVNCLQHAAHFAPELSARATSLEIESHEPVDRVAVARQMLTRLDEWVGRIDGAADKTLSEAWLARSGEIGQRIELVRDGVQFRGTVVDLDPSEGLLVQLDGGGRALFDPLTTRRGG